MSGSGFERLTFCGDDGNEDWYLIRRVPRPRICLLYLHGHGSGGDQLLTRPDIAEKTAWFEEQPITILSPNLRGNAWMNPAAVRDLRLILESERARNPWRHLLIVSGSMGGTGGLIFSMLHPELVSGCAALGAAVDLPRYLAWLARSETPILREIRAAIETAYPEESDRIAHSVLRHAERLTMPVYFAHGSADEIIPVEGARALRDRLDGRAEFFYREIDGGDHDSPLPDFIPAYRKLEALLPRDRDCI